MDGNYILNLNLSIIDLKKDNDDFAIIDEKEKNEIIMKEKEDENDDKKDEILKREDIEKIQPLSQELMEHEKSNSTKEYMFNWKFIHTKRFSKTWNWD